MLGLIAQQANKIPSGPTLIHSAANTFGANGNVLELIMLEDVAAGLDNKIPGVQSIADDFTRAATFLVFLPALTEGLPNSESVVALKKYMTASVGAVASTMAGIAIVAIAAVALGPGLAAVALDALAGAAIGYIAADRAAYLWARL